MIDLFSLLLLALTTVILMVALWVVSEKLANFEAAWPHRKAIAQIAAEIEHDPNSSPQALEYIAKVADHAFDNKLFSILKTQDKPDGTERLGLQASLCKRYGDRYGDLLYTAIRELAYVVMLSDFKWARQVRKFNRNSVSAKDIKSARTERIQIIMNWFDTDDHDSHTRHPVHAH